MLLVPFPQCSTAMILRINCFHCIDWRSVASVPRIVREHACLRLFWIIVIIIFYFYLFCNTKTRWIKTACKRFWEAINIAENTNTMRWHVVLTLREIIMFSSVLQIFWKRLFLYFWWVSSKQIYINNADLNEKLAKCVFVLD